MRRPLIAGNWKMYKRFDEALDLVSKLKAQLADVGDRDILVCVPFPFLKDVAQALKGTNVRVGAQNMHFEKEGAFTGEVSGAMLLSVGCEYVILGHSERRHVFGESDEAIHRKMLSALGLGLKPILCVGETLEQREAGATIEVVGRQLRSGLDGVSSDQAGAVTIAYEPVWAIGTGKTATPQQGQEVHAFIRKEIQGRYGDSLAASMRILYGGSVKPDNARALLAEADIDGFLVGGASLKADSFGPIVRGGI
ncbi:MAG: triose-phosphate isomerase [Planctomycetes bacterium]|nr:triose-phosphate isomerase [Planctomycetota bacterium]